MRKKFYILILLSFIALIIFVFYHVQLKYKSLIIYEERLLDVEFDKYVQYEDGRILREWIYEDDDCCISEYAIVKFSIKSGYEDKMIKELDDKCGRDAKLSTPLFVHIDDTIQTEINSKKIFKSYELFLDGEYGKVTRYVIICVVWENDKLYVYIFG